MSSGERESVTVRHLLEEAKKRSVLLVVSAIGLSYLMSLTSKSIFINFPAAALLILMLRYLYLDFEMRRRAATYKGKPMSANNLSERKPSESPEVVDRSDWRQKVNSPVVEDAFDRFSRHIVAEWVIDLWYSRITPDRKGPEELVLIMNGIIGEISSRMRNINLIDLFLRDVINLVCSELELFRISKAKIEKQQPKVLTIEELDIALKSVLADDNKLHRALFSAEVEHKFLQHVADGLILFTSKPLDLQCSLFRYISRELLACAVLRPALNLASPQFINERIENLVISLNADKASKNKQPSDSGMQEKNSSDYASWSPDPSVTGVELVPLHKDQRKKDDGVLDSDKTVHTPPHNDPLLSVDSTPPWSALTDTDNNREIGVIEQHHSGEEWGDKLDLLIRRKTEALAPEHFENMWTRGRNYRRKQYTSQQGDSARRNTVVGVSDSMEKPKLLPQREKESGTTGSSLRKKLSRSGQDKTLSDDYDEEDDDDEKSVPSETEYLNSSYPDDEELSYVTGLDSPGVIVWDGKSRRNASQIHHPLEVSDRHKSAKPKTHIHHFKRLHRNKPANKRSRSGEHVWKEVERTSFLSGDRQDILSNFNINSTAGYSSEDSEAELFGRVRSGAKTSSSMSLSSFPEGQSLAADSAKKSIVADSFLRLRCEVLGANIVKSGSKTFAVYSLSVTDVNNNSWSIKRRCNDVVHSSKIPCMPLFGVQSPDFLGHNVFRHFEELHRRLKDFTEYNLPLPPKHFLSTGLDVYIIQERCKLLDEYLKKLLQLPTVSCSIEVWDFLSVDSQMYTFSNPLYIIQTLPGGRDGVLQQYNEEQYINSVKPINDFSPSRTENTEELRKTSGDSGRDTQIPEAKNISSAVIVKLEKTIKFEQDSDSVKSNDCSSDPTLPIEWRPPNLSAPILDLVDVVLQLKDGGWIRRKAFWVAKQVLRLGMGDAFDDWIVEKILLLRKGSVVASGINQLEQILWPDGIFITKHPRPPEYTSSPEILEDAHQLEDMKQKEAERRAKLVYEIMIDKAPAAVVGLVGRREYQQCAKDLYYFIQSSVCTKQLAYRRLQLLLLSAFPELDYVFRQLEEEKLDI